MIAALVLLALAASTQVQAFPGSDPIAEALAVLPEHSELLSAKVGDSVLCLIGYLSKVQDLVANGKQELKPVEDAVASLVESLKACSAQSGLDKVTCGLQAVRDSWEGSDEVRAAVELVAKEAVALANEIKDKCFSSSHLHKQTLPRQIVY